MVGLARPRLQKLTARILPTIELSFFPSGQQTIRYQDGEVGCIFVDEKVFRKLNHFLIGNKLLQRLIIKTVDAL